LGAPPDAPPASEADSDDVFPETLHITVDVHVDGDQILGQAGDGITDPKPFTGWLGLIGALDGLIRVAAEGDAPGAGAPAPK
jgi:hypothetical protein